jgi:hypothetical protein
MIVKIKLIISQLEKKCCLSAVNPSRLIVPDIRGFLTGATLERQKIVGFKIAYH